MYGALVASLSDKLLLLWGSALLKSAFSFIFNNQSSNINDSSIHKYFLTLPINLRVENNNAQVKSDKLVPLVTTFYIPAWFDHIVFSVNLFFPVVQGGNFVLKDFLWSPQSLHSSLKD